jgi:putative peptidoglycan lipid II flippase
MAMAGGTMVSRLTGLVRAATLSAAIGATTVAANAFDVANNLPNFIYAILAEGVLNAILVPQIVKAFGAGRGEDYVHRLLTLGTVALAGLTVALTLAAGGLVWAFTKDWSQEQLALATLFAYWCIPQVFFYGLYSLWGQVLNARRSFAPFMWAPVANNVISIAGFAVFIVLYGRGDHPLESWHTPQITLLAGTATLGIVCQTLMLLVPLHRLGLMPRWRWGFRGYGLGTAARLAGWTGAALVVSQGAMWVAVKLASGAAEAAGPGQVVASNAAFTYALATYIIPHSLITVSLTTALFTDMSEAVQRWDYGAVRRDLSYGIRTTSAFSFFFTAALVVLAVPLVRVLFLGVPWADVHAIAGVLVALSLGLVPLGITLLIKRVFFAFEDGRTLFWLQVPMSGLWVVFSLASVKWLPPAWWVIGIGLGQSLSFLAGAVLRLNTVRDRLRGVDGPQLALMHLRGLVAAGVCGVAGYFGLRALPYGTVAGSLLALVVVGLGMAVIYAAVLRVLGGRELADFAGPMLARLRRR